MNQKSIFREPGYQGYYILSLMMMVVAFSFDTPAQIFTGFKAILLSPSNLLTDYMLIGGIGAAFFNSGLLLLMTLLMLQRLEVRLTGVLISAIMTVAGFSFFGKNLINSFPIPIGVMLYARWKKIPFASVAHVSLFSTGIAPLISEMLFGVGLEWGWAIAVSLFLGLSVGFIITPLSVHFLSFHQGYNLYNVGFTAGVIAMMIVGFLRMFNIDITPKSLLYKGDDTQVLIVLILALSALLISGLIMNKGLKGFTDLIKQSGRLPSDYFILYSKGLVYINMSLLGFMTILYVKIAGGLINGPILGGIFTVVGFGAFGKHVKNVVPILAGVYLSSLVNIHDPSGTESILVGLFGTTMAPIAGQFGVVVGMAAGVIHNAMAMNIGFLHGGVNLYNNGFSGGFVAAIIVPIVQQFMRGRDMQWKGKP